MTPEDEIVHKDWDKYPVGAYEKALSEPTAFGRLLIEAARAARLEALEEAAKIADARAALYLAKKEKRGLGTGDFNRDDLIMVSELIAAAIRELAKG